MILKAFIHLQKKIHKKLGSGTWGPSETIHTKSAESSFYVVYLSNVQLYF